MFKDFKKKSVYILLFALVLNLFSNIIYAVSDNELDTTTTVKTETVEKAKGNVELDINLDLPSVNTKDTGVYLKITSEEGYSNTVSFNSSLTETKTTITLGSKTVEVKLRKLDYEGKALDTGTVDTKVSYYAVTFYNLETGKYSFEITKNEQVVGKVTDVSLKDFSKRITFSNLDGSLFVGDLNLDGVINNKDADLMIASINTNNTSLIKKYDLNSDGKVDIVDLAYIVNNIGVTKKAPKVENTSAIINLNTVTAKVNGEDFDVKTLLSDNSKVSKLEPEDKTKNISKDNPVEIAMNLQTSVLTKEIRIVPNELSLNNAPTSLVIEVEDVNGKKYEIPYNIKESSSVSNFTDESSPNTIVIALDGQIAIRKITIKIEGTKTNTNLVEIAKVELLNNVYDKPPAPNMNIPSNVKATPESEAVKVTWNAEPNVTGYQVRIERKDENTIYETKVFQTSYTNYTINDLKNYTEYYVSVQAVNGEWKSPYSDDIKVTPIPNRKPPAPENISITPGYLYLNISWKNMKDTTSYNLYYRKKGDLLYTKISNISATSYNLQNLKDGTEYEIYLTGNNELGEGSKSQVYLGKTAVGLAPTITPNYKLINTSNGVDQVTSHIKDVSYVINTEGPNASTFDKFDIVDNDFSSYWQLNDWTTGADYNSYRSPIVELDSNYLMDTFILTPYENQNSYYYKAIIVYYDENNNKQVIQPENINISSRNDSNGKQYYVIKTNRAINANKVQINLSNSNGYTRKITISEMKFYYYDSIATEIQGIYKDDLHIELKDNVTLDMINDLTNRLNTKDIVSGEYHPDRDILLKDLELAKQILQDTYISNVYTVDKTISNSRNGHLGFAMALNDYQPLGIVARAGEQLAVYIGSNGSVMPELVFTQYYAESGWWTSSITNLKKGLNIVTVPKIGNMDTERGGSVYVRYPKNVNDNTVVKIRVSGGEKIPTLDITNLNEQEAKIKIREYIVSLNAHVNNLPNYYANRPAGTNVYAYSEQTSPLNSTEIVTKNVILSVQATKVLNGIKQNRSSLDEQVNGLYDSLTAFEEIMTLMYKEKGLSANPTEAADGLPSSRINIRYMRMFDGAFMYAGGFHIGIEGGSIAPLMQGKPKTVIDSVTRTLGYFGWGISHEIGHQIDEGNMIYGETSNNIFSLLVQTADDINKSRLETSDMYKSIYEKVTSNTKGVSSNVFVTLGMFWQLRLAYDDEPTLTSTDTFYSRLNKEYRRDLTTGADKDNLLIRLSSDAAGKDLTDFFIKWGLEPTEATKEYIKEKGYEKETRHIEYLNDEARRYRINGGNAAASDTSLSVDMKLNDIYKTVNFTFNVNKESDKILGYEIKRNGVVIAFTESNEYTDELASFNNKVAEYEITVYDKLLNKVDSKVLEPTKISYSGTIKSDKFSITSNVRNTADLNTEENPSGPIPNATVNNLIDNNENTVFNGNVKVKATDTKSDAYVIIELKDMLSIAGLKYTAILNNGTLDSSTIKDYEIYVSNTGKDNDWTLAKKGKFSKLTADNNSETIYFDKAGVTGGNQLWTYQVAYVKVVAKNSKTLSGAEISVIAPPGDNVELDTIGILENEYKYGLNDTDVIPSGSVIFKGNYRGNPGFNVVLLTLENGEVLEGEQIILAKLNDDASVDEVADGTWIFYITPEGYNKISGKIKANLYRTDNALTFEGQRFVSDTLYMNLKPYSDLPKVQIESNK